MPDNIRWPLPVDPHLRRWMMFVDGENFTIRGQHLAGSNSLTLAAGSHYEKDVFLWFPGLSAHKPIWQSTAETATNGCSFVLLHKHYRR